MELGLVEAKIGIFGGRENGRVWGLASEGLGWLGVVGCDKMCRGKMCAVTKAGRDKMCAVANFVMANVSWQNVCHDKSRP